MTQRGKSDYLPLRYVLEDGKPVTVLPYDTFSNDGELERVPAVRPGADGFAVWLERRLRMVSGEELARDLGVGEAMVRRWIGGGYNERGRWVTMDSIALATIDRAMTRADESLWAIYPYLDDDLEVDVAYCHRCLEDVMPVEGVCPWCETSILSLELEALPEVAYRRRGVGRKRAKLRTVKRPTIGTDGWAPLPKPDAPAVRTGSKRVYKRRGDTRLTPELIEQAHRLYYEERWGFDRIAKHLHDGALYRTHKSLSRAIYGEFVYRGWPRRDRIEATRLASYKHGLAPRKRTEKLGAKAEGNYRRWLKHERGEMQPRCRGTVCNGERKGKRCLRPSVTGQKFCQSHLATAGDELRARKQRQHLEGMWARSHASELPAEPFAVWLELRRKDFPSGKAMARAIAGDGNAATAHTLVIKLVKRQRAAVRRETVERVLATIGDGMTVEALYAPLMQRDREAVAA